MSNKISEYVKLNGTLKLKEREREEESRGRIFAGLSRRKKSRVKCRIVQVSPWKLEDLLVS